MQSSTALNPPRGHVISQSKKPSFVLQCSALLLVLACAGSTQLLAQFRTSLSGTVTDPQGAVVPNAKVTLKDTATNAQLVRTSDGAGLFNFGALAPDTFTLTAEAAGFQKKVLTNLKFIPEQPKFGGR